MQCGLETEALADFIVTPGQLDPDANQKRELTDGKLKLNRDTIIIQP
jgi:hypothetical protein